MTATTLCPRAAVSFPQPPPLGLLRAVLGTRTVLLGQGWSVAELQRRGVFHEPRAIA
ncbi:MAG: hypothetical protein J0M28_17265 [Thauera sp.]|nr:hypothetical protein [Thauera sp.]